MIMPGNLYQVQKMYIPVFDKRIETNLRDCLPAAARPHLHGCCSPHAHDNHTRDTSLRKMVRKMPWEGMSI